MVSSPVRLPVVVFACQVLQSMLEQLLPDDLARQVTFLDYGLHRVPSNMTWTLQDAMRFSLRDSTLSIDPHRWTGTTGDVWIEALALGPGDDVAAGWQSVFRSRPRL